MKQIVRIYSDFRPLWIGSKTHIKQTVCWSIKIWENYFWSMIDARLSTFYFLFKEITKIEHFFSYLTRVQSFLIGWRLTFWHYKVKLFAQRMFLYVWRAFRWRGFRSPSLKKSKNSKYITSIPTSYQSGHPLAENFFLSKQTTNK